MSEEVGLEHLEPDGYLQPRRYRITYVCERCGHKWKRTVTRLDSADPPCPVQICRETAQEEEINRRAFRLAKMLDEQRAPGHIGQSVIVKAVDETAKIVMEDHHMTNLQDNVREGDMVRPKLPPEQQKVADGFFGGQALAERYGGGRARSRQMELIGRRALAGAFRGMALNPGQVIPGQEGEPALRPIGKEALKG